MTDTLTALEAEIAPTRSAAEAFHITDAASYREAGEFLVEIKTARGRVEDERQAIAVPAYHAWKNANDFFSKLDKGLRDAEDALKSKIAAYMSAAKAVEAVAVANLATAEEHSLLAIVDSSAPTVDGVTTRSVTEWRVVDMDAVPRAYLMLDKAEVTAAIKRGEQVPGIETFQTTKVSARRRRE